METKKNKYIKKILMGMTFMAFGLHINGAQASQLSSLDDSGKRRWWQPFGNPSQSKRLFQFEQMSPMHVYRQLALAVDNGKPSTVLQILLLNSVYPRIQQDQASDLLHRAIGNGDFFTSIALLFAWHYDENGVKKPLCDVNFTHNGLTLLMRATANRQMNIIDSLLREGADPFIATSKGTALSLAVLNDNPDLIARLLQKTEDRRSAFQNPSIWKAWKIQFLNQTNCNGETLFSITFKLFVDSKLSAASFALILSCSDCYNPDNPRNAEICNNLMLIREKLEKDGKWYRFSLFRNFDMDPTTRQNSIQMINNFLEHVANCPILYK
jgi:hypothetical protein